MDKTFVSKRSRHILCIVGKLAIIFFAHFYIEDEKISTQKIEEDLLSDS